MKEIRRIIFCTLKEKPMNFHDFWNSVQRLSSLITFANWGIALSLLLSFTFTVVSITASKKRETLVSVENSQRVAEANQKAEEEHLARMKIEERLAGWTLGAEAQARLTEQLRPFAKTPFDLSVNPNEVRFMEVLDAVLSNAGWSWKQPKASGSPPPGRRAIPLLLSDKAGINAEIGIRIEVAQERMHDLQPAAGALADGLLDEGIPVTLIALRKDDNPTAVHVVIGHRE
jgi:hypothetical protein